MSIIDRGRGTTPRGVSATRLVRFTAVMYKPQYLLYGILWTLAFEGTAAHLSGQQWRPGAATVVRIVVVVIVLLYLRMVDEQKDLEYDRLHHPDRPLVTGAVTAADLRVGMAVISVVAVGVSALLSWGSAVAIAVVLAYGLGLWAAESMWPALRDGVLVNLAITYPIQLLIAGYVLVSGIGTGQIDADGRVGWAVLIVAAAFLQFEFARKISRRPRPGEMYYSNAVGAWPAVGVSLGLVAVAVGASLVALAPWQFGGWPAALGWLPLATAMIPGPAAVAFRRGGDDYSPVPAVIFVLALYLELIVAVLVVPAS
ncbi:hypothetical protein ABLE92_04825 [Gordonia sp. VNQ95]|uniref:hypothetical protein n=1 Tax=Gordonia TaxID=2053 RepID=UPI0032B3BFB4